MTKDRMENHDVILTGVPRSGTTLVCYLLNKLPNTVALSEPMQAPQLATLRDHEVICDEVDRFFEQSRKSLLEHGTAISRHVAGRVPDDPAEDRYYGLFRLLRDRFLRSRSHGVFARPDLRKLRASQGVIKVEKALSSDFLLCVKHNPFFAVLLESLHCRYPCYAIVRNPLSTLASWNSVAFLGWDGHAPAAERLDQDLAQKLAKASDRLERQLVLLSWCFDRYYTVLPAKNILRYEDIVASGGAVLKAITRRTLKLNEPLENRNTNKLYNRDLTQMLGKRLLEVDGAFWEFYSKESVELLLNEIVG